MWVDQLIAEIIYDSALDHTQTDVIQAAAYQFQNKHYIYITGGAQKPGTHQPWSKPASLFADLAD